MIQKNQALKTLFQVTGAITGCFAVGSQLYIILKNTHAEGLNYAAEVIRFFSYMTIWTNILVMLFFLCPLFFPGSGLATFFKRPLVQTGIALYVSVVAVVYHFLLANIWEPTGLQYLTDILLHYVMPLFYLLYWILFAPRGLQKFQYSVLWLVFPLVYIVYALLRGALGNVYPYPFIDVSQLGYGMVIRNIILLTLAYLASGILLVLIDRGLAKLSRRQGTTIV